MHIVAVEPWRTTLDLEYTRHATRADEGKFAAMASNDASNVSTWA